MPSETPNEASIFNTARKIASGDERSAYLHEACQGNTALLERVEKLLSAYEVESKFLEQPATELDATIVPDSSGQHRAASLQAGLAAAFREDQSVVIGHAGHSVLKSLGQSIDVPRVLLRGSEAEGADPIVRPTSPEMPQRVSDSRYRLDGEIARGGMGAILKGRDTDLGRDLAIKILLDQHKNNPEIVQRFIEEAQIGGQLQHPGIAPIYELGQFADKRPFFSMKLVKGETLAKLLADRKEANSERGKFLGIFEQICQTMAYAHSRGVIHRDLKPANIMVGAFGEVQVMDWGLAKVLSAGGVADETKAHDQRQGQSVIQTLRSAAGSDAPGTIGTLGSQTQMGSVMGTPAYMPPEQALGEIDHLDERADVFGLGAILCEILTGQPPYVADDGTRVFRMASRGKLADCFTRLDASGADEELIALTKHCLELEPKDRPRDAGELADRVSGYLESVETKLRQSEIERAAESARVAELYHRRKLHYAIVALLLVGLMTAGFAASHFRALEQSQRELASTNERLANDRERERNAAVSARDAEATQRRRAEAEQAHAESATQEAEAEKVRSLNMLADMQTDRGIRAGRERQSGEAALWFANAAALTPHDPDRQLANHRRAQSWLGEAMEPVALLKVHGATEGKMEFQSGGPLALTVNSDRLRIWIWRYETVLPWSNDITSVVDAAWSPDGKQLAVGFTSGEVKFFEPNSGDVLRSCQHSERACMLKWSPDGTRLAVGGSGVQIWNVTGEMALESDWPHPQKVYGLNFNRTGTRLVTACEDNLARVFAIGDATQSAPLFAPLENISIQRSSSTVPVFCDDGRKLVTLRQTRRPTLWDAETGQNVDPGWKDPGHQLDQALTVSQDGRWIAVAGEMTCLLANIDGTSIVLPHSNFLHNVIFSPNGQSVVTLSFDGIARVWPLDRLDRATVSAPMEIPQQSTFADGVFSPDGTALAIAANGQFVIWEREQNQNLPQEINWIGKHWKPRVSYDGCYVTPGARHSYAYRWQAQGDTLSVARAVDGLPAGPPIRIEGLLFDSCVCGDHLSVAAVSVLGDKGILAVFDVASGSPKFSSIKLSSQPYSVSARPGRPQVAVLCEDGTLEIIDTRTGDRIQSLQHDGWQGEWTQACVEYSPDGATLVSVTPNDLVFVRDAETNELRFPALKPVIELGPCRATAFSPDSRLLATAVCGRNIVQVWDLITGEKVSPGLPHPGDYYGLWSVEFSPDGRQILTSHKDGRIRIWNWKSGQLDGATMNHPDDVCDARFTADGRYVLAGVRNATVHVWDVTTRKLAVPPIKGLIQPEKYIDCLRIIGDHAVVSAQDRFSVVDLSVLLRMPDVQLASLLTRAELATNQKVQLGEPVPLEQPEWEARWEQLDASRQTPEAAAESLATALDAATDASVLRVIVARAARLGLLARLQTLRPNEPRVNVAFATELSRQGNLVEAKHLRGLAIKGLQDELTKAPEDALLMHDLANVIMDDVSRPKWSLLGPTSMHAESNCTFMLQPDGSILAGAVTTPGDLYTIVCRSPLRRVAAVRLETLPHSSLPEGGAGWDGVGNFNLTEAKATLRHPDGTVTPLSFRSAASDYIRPPDQNTSANDGPWGAIDSEVATHWDAGLSQNMPHWLTLQLMEPCDLAEADELLIELEFKSYWHNSRLGCFRLSCAVDEHAGEIELMRIAIRDNALIGVEAIAAAHLLHGDPTTALEWLKPAVEKSSTATAMSRLLVARALLQLGQTEAAQKQLLESAALPTPPRLLQRFPQEIAMAIGGDTPEEFRKALRATAAERIASEAKRILDTLRTDPASLAVARDQLAALGKWSAAARVARQEVDAAPTDRSLFFRAAVLMLFADDVEGYRKHCLQGVERFGTTSNAGIADSLIKACLILSDAVDQSKLPLKVLRDATTDPKWEPDRDWFVGNCALAAYRAGQPAEAIEWTKKVSSLNAMAGAFALVVRAMAEEKLGHHEQAVKTLLEVDSLIPAELSTLGTVDHEGPLPVPVASIYADWLAPEILRREAALLIHKVKARHTTTASPPTE